MEQKHKSKVKENGCSRRNPQGRRNGDAGAASRRGGARTRGGGQGKKERISAKANLGHGLVSVRKITALTSHPPKNKFRPETCRNLEPLGLTSRGTLSKASTLAWRNHQLQLPTLYDLGHRGNTISSQLCPSKAWRQEPSPANLTYHDSMEEKNHLQL